MRSISTIKRGSIKTASRTPASRPESQRFRGNAAATLPPFFGRLRSPRALAMRAPFFLRMQAIGCAAHSVRFRHLVELIDLASSLTGGLEESLRVLDDFLLRIRLQQ